MYACVSLATAFEPPQSLRGQPHFFTAHAHKMCVPCIPVHTHTHTQKNLKHLYIGIRMADVGEHYASIHTVTYLCILTRYIASPPFLRSVLRTGLHWFACGLKTMYAYAGPRSKQFGVHCSMNNEAFLAQAAQDGMAAY